MVTPITFHSTICLQGVANEKKVALKGEEQVSMRVYLPIYWDWDF